jgi:ATP adenylyltransferase
MKRLWAPWRSAYIQSFKEEEPNTPPECFLCEAAADKTRDKEKLVVARFSEVFVVMNKFPYNNGHLLVTPLRHVGEMKDLTASEISSLFQTVKICIDIIDEVSKPHGYNIGMNLGRIAGAGVPGHLHVHVVPRWSGDTNFMPVCAETKVVSQSLYDSQVVYSEAFSKHLLQK